MGYRVQILLEIISYIITKVFNFKKNSKFEIRPFINFWFDFDKNLVYVVEALNISKDADGEKGIIMFKS